MTNRHANSAKPLPPTIPLATSPGVVPADATAVIRQPSRSVTTSGKRGSGEWVLSFERRTPPVVEPLMGWTGGEDTMVQVNMRFPTRATAVAFAERQRFAYRVEGASEECSDHSRHYSTFDIRRGDGDKERSGDAPRDSGKRLGIEAPQSAPAHGERSEKAFRWAFWVLFVITVLCALMWKAVAALSSNVAVT